MGQNELVTTRNELDQKLIAAVDRLGRALRVVRQEVATELQVSLLQLQIIEHIDRLGPRRVGLLASELDVTPPTVSDAVAVLRRKGLLERRPDPDDGRSTLSALTKKGERLAVTARDALARDALHGGLAGDRVDSEQDQATALKVVLGEIHRMQQAGVITVNRSCFSCSHYQRPTKSSQGRCLLLQTDLTNADVRVDCPEHKPAP